MERVNPALDLLMSVRRAVESGESPRAGLVRYAREAGEFPKFCRRWLERRDGGADHMALLSQLKSPHRRALFQIFDRGLSGEPIHALLVETEKEIGEACRREIDRHLALLPFKMMIPLLLFLFPAILILLLAPFLDAVAEGFGG